MFCCVFCLEHSFVTYFVVILWLAKTRAIPHTKLMAMDMSIDELLAHCQELASRLDGSDSPDCTPRGDGETRGMGAISLLFHPYERGWMAKADWSDSSKVATPVSARPESALETLRDLLADEAERATWDVGRGRV